MSNMKRSFFRGKAFSIFADSLWHNNAIFGMVLGMCSSLAVTTTKNALVMALCVVFVLLVSSFLISLIRNLIPDQIRMIVFMLIISTFVITADFIVKIYVPDIARQLGPYIGLIITNCILMGRAEAFAVKNPPRESVMDALGSGLGYGGAILLIALVRELLGSGTLFDVVVIPSWPKWGLMGIAPGAFFVLGFLTIGFNFVRSRMKRRKDKERV